MIVIEDENICMFKTCKLIKIKLFAVDIFV